MMNVSVLSNLYQRFTAEPKMSNPFLQVAEATR
jgi:hypothetical protein